MSVLLRAHRPESPVAFAGEGDKTRSDLERNAQAIGLTIEQAAPGAYVVLACTDRYWFAAGLLAAWSRGLRVALPANGRDETVHHLVRTLEAVALLHDREQALGTDVRKCQIESVIHANTVSIALGRDDVAVVAFTSGSSGEPQAHEKSLAQLLDEAQMLALHFQLAGCRVLAAVPPHHLYGLLFGVLVPLCSGGAFSRTSPLLPADLRVCAERERVDVLVAVPPHLRALSQHEAWQQQAFRRVFSSGGPLLPEVARALSARGMPITEVLGSTETGGVAFRTDPESAWTALPGVQVSVAASGALCVASPWLSAKVAEPMTTQDRAKLVDGGFEHLGRLDDVVKVGGRRVDLGEIETKLRAIEGVRDARVLAEEGDAARGTTLLAVVEADGLTVEALRAHLTVSVDPVVIPKRFRVVSAMPRNATGKITRSALCALFDTWSLPVRSDESGRMTLQIPANSGFFRGHFEGDPILPGVVQLRYLALAQARKRWTDLGMVVRVTRVKFKRPIRPGERLALCLTRKRPELVEFSLTCGDEVASSGLLHFGSSDMSGVRDA